MTIQRKSKRPQVAKDWTRKIFKWLRQVKDDHELPPSGALFALQLTEHFNRHHGGAAWASCEYIAAGIGMSKGTVVNLLHLFEWRGHLKVQWGKPGRGHSNHYWMVLKGQSADLSETIKGQIKSQSDARKGQWADLNLLNNHLMVSSKEETHKRERSADAHTPPDVAPALNGRAPSKKEKGKRSLTPEEDAPKKKIGTERDHYLCASETHKEGLPLRENVVVVLHTGGDHFNALWGIWRRGWAQDDAPNNKAEAQRAFVKACNHPDPEVRADPQEIIERARSWVAGFPDEPRFLPKLVSWLAGRGWETEPPERRPRHYYRRGKPNTALMMADYARQLELEEARS
jgi:hypothetical protein